MVVARWSRSLDHQGRLNDPSQPENVAVGASQWHLTGNVDLADAEAFLAPHLVEGPALLGNRGAAVPEQDAMRGVEASLALVRPQAVEFHLEPPWDGVGRRRPRVGFELDGQDYDLALTDYVVAPRLMRAGLGNHALADLGFSPASSAYLTVSLAEARDDWCTKLAAAVLFVPDEA